MERHLDQKHSHISQRILYFIDIILHSCHQLSRVCVIEVAHRQCLDMVK